MKTLYIHVVLSKEYWVGSRYMWNWLMHKYQISIENIIVSWKYQFPSYITHELLLKFMCKCSFSCRCLREDFDGDELDNEFCSDENESDKFSRSVSNNSSKGWDASSGDTNIDHEDILPMRDSLTNLYFKFHDSCPPYWRIPLFDKVNILITFTLILLLIDLEKLIV